MTTEEKYKDALEKARKIWYETEFDYEKGMMEEIFPELKESDDERIRKEIISIVKSYRKCCITEGNHRFDDCIAWLEKQCEQKPVDKVETIYEIGDFVHCITINGFEYTYIYKSNHGKVIHAFVNYSCGTDGVVSIDDTLFEPSIFTKRKATTKEIVTLLQSIHKNGFIWDAEKKELKEIEHKSNNNTEPKFKVGDWVVYNNGNTYQVEEISDERYELINNFGDKLSIPMCWEESLRLWTIQDAKDGDVLYFDDDTIVMFKDLYNSSTFHSYCHIEYGLFGINMDDLPDWWESEGFHPASKKQRDFLFQKMSEAGYEWDSKTKQLIKKQL